MGEGHSQNQRRSTMRTRSGWTDELRRQVVQEYAQAKKRRRGKEVLKTYGIGAATIHAWRHTIGEKPDKLAWARGDVSKLVESLLSSVETIIEERTKAQTERALSRAMKELGA